VLGDNFFSSGSRPMNGRVIACSSFRVDRRFDRAAALHSDSWPGILRRHGIGAIDVLKSDAQAATSMSFSAQNE